MRRACALALLLLCTAAHAEVHATVGPYVQNLQSDGFTVVFETAEPVHAEVHAGAVRVATEGTHHEAVLRGLRPGTHAAYRVLAGGVDLGGGDVALPDPAARSLTFVVYGDTRNSDEEAQLAGFAASLHPELALHTGDLVPMGDSEAGWHAFFDHERPFLADVPVYPTLGNHEIFRDPEATHFRRYFALPDDGRDKLYYRFRVGPALFVVLDGNNPSPVQTAWLRAQLEASAAEHVPHVFVLVHQPPLSLGDHCGAAPAQADWMALFEQYRVSAVFGGHDHAYERLERRGVRYFVSGGGGAPLYGERRCAPFDRAARRTYLPIRHLLAVRVRGGDIEVSALAPDAAGPIEVTRFAAGEPLFAMDAPPIERTAPTVTELAASTEPATDEPHSTRTWTLAGGAAIFLLFGFLLRRRRPR